MGSEEGSYEPPRGLRRAPARRAYPPAMRRIGSSDLSVHPLCLGTNIFGWTMDERAGVRRARRLRGGRRQLHRHGRLVLGLGATATAAASPRRSSAAGWPRAATATGSSWRPRSASCRVSRASRRRRSARPPRTRSRASAPTASTSTTPTWTTTDTPLEDTLGAFGELVARGQGARTSRASNYTRPRLAEALAVARASGLPAYVAVQPHYNLVAPRRVRGRARRSVRARGPRLRPVLRARERLPDGQVPPRRRRGRHRRAPARRAAYLDERGLAVLAALDEIAAATATTVAAVALAWLAAQPAVVAPIASARTPEQLADLLPMDGLELSGEELQYLTDASAR